MISYIINGKYYTDIQLIVLLNIEMQPDRQFVIQLGNAKILGKYSQNSLLLQLQSMMEGDLYVGKFTDETLPDSIELLFDSTSNFYEYLNENKSKSLSFKNQKLYVSVEVLNKIKQVKINLQKVQISPEEKQKRKIGKLLQNNHWMEEKIRKQQLQIQQLHKINRGLIVEVAQLQNRVYEQVKYGIMKQQGDAAVSQFGKKHTIQIDVDNNKYIDRFQIVGAEVAKTKENSQTHQFYGIKPIPKVGKHYFTMKALNLIDNTIRVGVMTGENRQAQFCGNKIGCICYSGNGGYLYQQTKSTLLQRKPMNGQKMTVVVDFYESNVTFYIENDAIGRASIPAEMQGCDLYPYFDMFCVQTKILLNS